LILDRVRFINTGGISSRVFSFSGVFMFDHFLFVYGTLKRKQRANYLLQDQQYVGTAVTKPYYLMYACFSHPALIKSITGTNIHGEIYGINDDCKEKVDRYEGVDYGLYLPEPVELEIFNPEEKYKNLVLEKVVSYIYYGNITSWRKVQQWP